MVVQHKVCAHHGATGEYGVEMNRNPRLCLESEGRGGGDGWERNHARENEKIYKQRCNFDSLERDRAFVGIAV